MEPELARIARSLVWWKPPDEVDFLYLVRRVMNMGTWEMIRTVQARSGSEVFFRALQTAEMGEFSRRSWIFWNVFFRVAPVPRMPQRVIPEFEHLFREFDWERHDLTWPHGEPLSSAERIAVGLAPSDLGHPTHAC